MAERRMFAKTIIDSDAFLDMPATAQLLYFHLCMRGDDDGFVNQPKSIMRMCGARDDDLKLLFAKKFVIPFETGVIAIKHWRIHNYIRKDTYTPTKYWEERQLLEFDKNSAYTLNPRAAGLPAATICDERVTEPSRDRDEPLTQDRLGKDRLVKDSEGKGSTDRGSGEDSPAPPPPDVSSPKSSKSPSRPKGIFETYAGDDENLLAALKGFDAMRKSIKKPLTDRAKNMIINKLKELAPDDPATQAAILDQSTLHSWQGVFALKDDQKGGAQDGNSGQSRGNSGKGWHLQNDLTD